MSTWQNQSSGNFQQTLQLKSLNSAKPSKDIIPSLISWSAPPPPIGANIHEANYAHGKADFTARLHIALKECAESEYWLELLFRKEKLSEEQYKHLRNQCGSIRRRLIASVTTAKEK